MRLWPKRRTTGEDSEERYNLSQLAQEKMFFGGRGYPLFGYGGYNLGKSESIESDFLGLVNGAYKSDGVVFACMAARQLVFTEARFSWQRLEKGRPGDLFAGNGDGTGGDLAVLERPWTNATTRTLLARALQDVDLAGNHYAVREGNRIRRLRPDWVEIVLTEDPKFATAVDVEGYKYTPGGPNGKREGKFYLPEDVAHWAPFPDPEAQYRGMSWLTPVIREIQADKQATLHKVKFFENGATPQLTVSVDPSVQKDEFKEFIEIMEASHSGVNNAYKTLYLGGGADVNVVGSDLKQLDFKQTQGAGETRIAAAARVHPSIVGLSEGMQGSSLNAGNWKAAKDGFGDMTLRPLWGGVCEAYGTIVRPPGGSRLWYDDRDIPFLRADMMERAGVQQQEAAIIRNLVDGGFKPESIIQAIRAQDWTLLVHTGLVSVQLLPPGQTATPAAPGADKPGAGGQSGKVTPRVKSTAKQQSRVPKDVQPDKPDKPDKPDA